MFRTDASPEPLFTDTLELDLGTVVPSLAGPRRPQDRIPLTESKKAFEEGLPSLMKGGDASKKMPVQMNGDKFQLGHGSVVISAITSCTNTSNPSVLIGAGLLLSLTVAYLLMLLGALVGAETVSLFEVHGSFVGLFVVLAALVLGNRLVAPATKSG